MSRLWITAAEEETRSLGETLAREFELVGHAVLLLIGEMGAGKTVFTQGVGRGLGVSEREVQSPTFTLVREHRGGRVDLIHLDLFRLEMAEVHAIGIEEILASPGLKVVEWAERLPPALRAGGTVYSFRTLADGRREIRESSPEGDSATREGR